MINRRTTLAAFAAVLGIAPAEAAPTLTAPERRMLRRAGMFAFAGEWPWDEGDEAQNETDQAALRSAILKLRD